MMNEVLTGFLGVVMDSDLRIILGVPSMLSWDKLEDLPEDRLLLLLPMDWPPDKVDPFSKLPSDILCIKVSVSDRLSPNLSLLPFRVSIYSEGLDGALLSGKYIFGFF